MATMIKNYKDSSRAKGAGRSGVHPAPPRLAPSPEGFRLVPPRRDSARQDGGTGWAGANSKVSDWSAVRNGRPQIADGQADKGESKWIKVAQSTEGAAMGVYESYDNSTNLHSNFSAGHRAGNLTRSFPLARPSRACGLARIPFAASRAAQVTLFTWTAIVREGGKGYGSWVVGRVGGRGPTKSDQSPTWSSQVQAICADKVGGPLLHCSPMSRPPLILVSPSIEKEGVEFHDQSISLSEAYPRAVVDAGGIPLTMPVGKSRELIAECVRRCDGVLMTGGDDIEPRLYKDHVPEQLQRTVDTTPDGGE